MNVKPVLGSRSITPSTPDTPTRVPAFPGGGEVRAEQSVHARSPFSTNVTMSRPVPELEGVALIARGRKKQNVVRFPQLKVHAYAGAKRGCYPLEFQKQHQRACSVSFSTDTSSTSGKQIRGFYKSACALT
mmetsp:Transcript_9798/g.14173  ORF Transcript_9798/g.14173 Transcript_9798/m.14173 type:complete len:131 (+) Transcript_9798:1798-2190(+)